MPFIDRDDVGDVSGLYGRQQFDGQEFLGDDHPDVVAYRNVPAPPKELSVEELYQMLEAKGVLVTADRPTARR